MKDNTSFYQRHIQQNIHRLEQRKSKFLSLRLGFIRQFYHPIQQKIDQTLAEIMKAKYTLQNIHETIQSEPEIARLKGEVEEYRKTNGFFRGKVEEYQQRAIEIGEMNDFMKKSIGQMREKIVMQREKKDRLPNIISIRHKTATPPINIPKYIRLPSIDKSYTQGVSTGQSRIKSRRIVGIGQKIQKSRLNHSHIVSGSQPIKQQQVKKESICQERSGRQALRGKITEFNKIEGLFKQCFQTKKGAVQKSVSQLQSKLITNRQQFLSTCQALGSKQVVPFQQFSILSADEIVTLFISFVWLNRKLMSAFGAKRQKVISLMGRLKQ